MRIALHLLVRIGIGCAAQAGTENNREEQSLVHKQSLDAADQLKSTVVAGLVAYRGLLVAVIPTAAMAPGHKV